MFISDNPFQLNSFDFDRNDEVLRFVFGFFSSFFFFPLALAQPIERLNIYFLLIVCCISSLHASHTVYIIWHWFELFVLVFLSFFLPRNVCVCCASHMMYRTYMIKNENNKCSVSVFLLLFLSLRFESMWMWFIYYRYEQGLEDYEEAVARVEKMKEEQKKQQSYGLSGLETVLSLIETAGNVWNKVSSEFEQNPPPTKQQTINDKSNDGLINDFDTNSNNNGMYENAKEMANERTNKRTSKNKQNT